MRDQVGLKNAAIPGEAKLSLDGEAKVSLYESAVESMAIWCSP